VLLVSAAAE